MCNALRNSMLKFVSKSFHCTCAFKTPVHGLIKFDKLPFDELPI